MKTTTSPVLVVELDNGVMAQALPNDEPGQAQRIVCALVPHLPPVKAAYVEPASTIFKAGGTK